MFYSFNNHFIIGINFLEFDIHQFLKSFKIFLKENIAMHQFHLNLLSMLLGMIAAYLYGQSNINCSASEKEEEQNDDWIKIAKQNVMSGPYVMGYWAKSQYMSR
jgi:hypothetical protein